jgi:hypothetical protein
VLFGENVFMIDFVIARVDSFEGVKNVYVYILTKWQYYDDWVIKETEERLLALQYWPHPIKSMKVAAAFKV